MSGSFEIRQVGQRRIATFRGGYIPDDLSQLKGQSFESLHFVQGEWSTLDWLAEQNITASKIFIMADIHDFSGVADVKGLAQLEVGYDGLNGLDFGRLGGLTRLDVPWNKRIKRKIGCLTGLQILSVAKYGESDLHEFSKLTALRHLKLTQGSIATLNGLEECRALEELELNYLRKLEDIVAVGSLDQLKVLHIKKCPHVKSVECVVRLSRLESLWIDADWGELVFGSWLLGKPKLRKLLCSTRIRDVDWGALLAQPEIDDIRIKVPKEQLPSEEAIAALIAKNDRQMVKFEVSGTKMRPWVGVYLMPITGELAPGLRPGW